MTHTPASADTAQTLDLEAVAHMLRCSIRYLRDLRQDDPTFPAPRMLGASPRWTYETIRAWVEQPAREAAVLAAAASASALDIPPSAPVRAKGAARVH